MDKFICIYHIHKYIIHDPQYFDPKCHPVSTESPKNSIFSGYHMIPINIHINDIKLYHYITLSSHYITLYKVVPHS